MNPTEFIDIYLSELLQKFSKEDKIIMLMREFNIDLLKYVHNTDGASFLDLLYTYFLPPYISTPSQVTKNLELLQNKALRIINFKNNEYNVNELYRINKILKIADHIKLLNCLFVRNVIAQSTIPPFQEIFIQMRDTHQYNTRHTTQNTVTLNQYKAAFYGTHLIKHKSTLIWNQVNNVAPSDLLQKSRSEIRECITNKFISNY